MFLFTVAANARSARLRVPSLCETSSIRRLGSGTEKADERQKEKKKTGDEGGREGVTRAQGAR